MKSKKNIVYVSVSSDMYGASKVLLSLVMQMKRQSKEYNPIVCMPFEEGPLKDILISKGIHIIEIGPLRHAHEGKRFQNQIPSAFSSKNISVS